MAIGRRWRPVVRPAATCRPSLIPGGILLMTNVGSIHGSRRWRHVFGMANLLDASGQSEKPAVAACVIMIIEEQENIGSISAEKLSEALAEMMHARIVCHSGRVLD